MLSRVPAVCRALRSPASISSHRPSIFQKRCPCNCTGRLGKRCTSSRLNCRPSKRARMTRPLSAPRSTAATLRVAIFLSPFPTSARIRRRDAAIDVEDIAGALHRACRRGEERHSLGDILRQDVDSQRRALAVHLLQLIGCHAVCCRTSLSPRAVPDARAGQHRVRVDGVHANAELPTLFCQAACQVRFGSFGSRIGGSVLASNQRILTGNKDQVAPTFQFLFHSARLVSVTGALEASPALLTITSIPPKARAACSKAVRTLFSSVTSILTAIARPEPKCWLRYSASCSAPARSMSVVTMCAPSCAARRQMAEPMPPAAPVTSTTCRANSRSGGASLSLYCSSGQYSTA